MRRAAAGGRIDVVDAVEKEEREKEREKETYVDMDACMTTAIINGHTDMCDRLMKSRFWDKLGGRETLARACETACVHNQVTTFKHLYRLWQGGSIPLIAKAAGLGRFEIFEWLMRTLGSFSGIPHKLEPIIYEAAIGGNIDIMRMLIDDRDVPPYMVSGALMFAAKVNAENMCLFLLERGASPCDEALIVAAEYGMMDLATALLGFKRNVVNVCAKKCEALVRAARGGHAEMCELLIAHGACPWARWNKPIKVAYENDWVHVVKVLVANGANTRAVSMPSREMFEFISEHM